MSDIRRVGVVGAGLMGCGIADVCARSGLDVKLHDVTTAALDLGRKRIEGSLARSVRAGKLSEEQRQQSLDTLSYTCDLGDFADCDLVIEAVVENEAVKADVFSLLDKVVIDEQAVFASNTSSIPIMRLAIATRRPAQVIGLHFFNPVPVLRLVEVIPCLLTAAATQARCEAFLTGVLGKTIVRCQDRAGFVVNALLIPYLLSAIRMFEAGFASAADIDQAMVLGCAHPMGPLALTDLIGLDTTMAVAETMYAEFKQPLYSPPSLLLRMVDAGFLGRKVGRGFHDYTEAGA